MANTDKVIRVPADAHAALVELASQDRRSVTQEVAWLALAELERRKGEDA